MAKKNVHTEKSKAKVVGKQVTHCDSSHDYIAVDVTPRESYSATATLGGIPFPRTVTPPTYKLYCSKCGEIRPL